MKKIDERKTHMNEKTYQQQNKMKKKTDERKQYMNEQII